MGADFPPVFQAAGHPPRRLYAFNAGLWRGDVGRILRLAGWGPRLGLPPKGTDAAVGVWGNSPTAWRGRAVARHRQARLVTVEDAFLRSVLPGRAKHAGGPLGLMIDPIGVHFDATRPSLLEWLIPQPAETDRARAGIARLQAADLSKYNSHHGQKPPAPLPEGYILVVDQTRGDASLCGAGRDRFLTMLTAARAENPGVPLVIRTHPETQAGLRQGHLNRGDLRPGEVLCDWPISPWQLVQGAVGVYTISSQLGYEAILAGHCPRVFGTPFYAGWGQSEDEIALPRRGNASVEQLFTASHLRAPVWYDAALDRICSFEDATHRLEAETRAWREDHRGHLAYGFRLWKRPAIARAFRPLRFAKHPGPEVTLAWANHADRCPNARRVEDGFLRSRGLGAALVPPLSLVTDDKGIYYDPTRPSRLEDLIAAPISPAEQARAAALVTDLLGFGLTKYNVGGADLPSLPQGRRILVPGQVEDDASLRLGSGDEATNLALLARVRRENPDAVIIYKPHPDVEAGLRPGIVPDDAPYDIMISQTDAAAILPHVDEVWTITSTLGFEALLRGVPVTCLGAPFYAGWGLTRDLGPIPDRRQARPDLSRLAHAVLIAYPRYFDPRTGRAIAPETAVQLLASGQCPAPPLLRGLAKVQGVLASYSWLWR